MNGTDIQRHESLPIVQILEAKTYPHPRVPVSRQLFLITGVYFQKPVKKLQALMSKIILIKIFKWKPQLNAKGKCLLLLSYKNGILWFYCQRMKCSAVKLTQFCIL